MCGAGAGTIGAPEAGRDASRSPKGAVSVGAERLAARRRPLGCPVAYLPPGVYTPIARCITMRGAAGGGGGSDQAYASWHMPHAGPCSQFCADWCHDFSILSYLTPLLDPLTSIRLGPRPRGEGSLAFPVVCELSDRLTD